MKLLYIDYVLNVITSLHTGTGEEGEVADKGIFKDFSGKPAVRGTSIAGVFRSIADRIAAATGEDTCFSLGAPENDQICRCKVCSIFGTNGQASRIEFSPPTLKYAGNKNTTIRDGVAINRKTGTASIHKKYDFESVSPDTEIRGSMKIFDPDKSEEIFIKQLLLYLTFGFEQIGGFASRGCGTFILDTQKSKVTNVDLHDKKNFINYLDNKECDKAIPLSDYIAGTDLSFKTTDDNNKSFSSIAVTLEAEMIPDSFALTATSAADSDEDVDIMPLKTRIRKNGKNIMAAFFPGSSIKGTFRSRAEKILRTLAGPESACYISKPASGDDSVSCDEKLEKMFDRKRPGFKELRKAGICDACLVFGNTYWQSRVFFTDFLPDEATNEKSLDFVSIDRFTGGALNSAKFNARVPIDGKFKGQIIIKNLDPLYRGLIALVIRDMISGDLRFGFGAGKGFGRMKIRVEKIRCLLSDLSPDSGENTYTEYSFNDLKPNRNRLQSLVTDFIKYMEEEQKKWESE